MSELLKAFERAKVWQETAQKIDKAMHTHTTLASVSDPTGVFVVWRYVFDTGVNSHGLRPTKKSEFVNILLHSDYKGRLDAGYLDSRGAEWVRRNGADPDAVLQSAIDYASINLVLVFSA